MKKAFDEFRHLYRITDDFEIENIGTGSGRTVGRRLRIFLRSENKYPSVQMTNESISRKVFLHRIIAEEFVHNPDPTTKTQVNHIDGDKWNWCPSNLEWTTGSDNIKHAYRTRLITPPNRKQILDLSMGIYYDSLRVACDARGLNPTRVATQIWRKRNNSGLIYV